MGDMFRIEYCDNPEITHITIPDNVTSIEDYEFFDCNNLTSVTIPDSVTSIGSYAFSGCASLTSITICDSVINIGHSTFCWCTDLTSINIPGSVTSIGDWVFFGCSNLTNITIPDSITSIGNGAFFGCKNLISKRAHYKAFEITEQGIMCRDYMFKPNEWTEDIHNPKLCTRGYHFCDNLFNIFNYYFGEIDKDIAIYECEIGDIVISDRENKKYVTNRIKPIKRLSRKNVIDILNNLQEEEGYV